MPGASDQATLVSLGEVGRAEAHRRWLVLRAHLEDGVPLTHVAAQSGIPYRTLQRWLARYQAGGLAGLGRAPRADRGRSRFPEPLRLLVEGLALRTPVPSAAQVHRQVTAVAEREGWPVRRRPGHPAGVLPARAAPRPGKARALPGHDQPDVPGGPARLRAARHQGPRRAGLLVGLR